MGMYKSSTVREPTLAEAYSRQDIERYQSDLNNYIAQFQQERQEAEALFNDVRQQQALYEEVIQSQNSRIDALSTLVINLTNRLGALENGMG